jgi:ABC-type lipoprotein export system ATPase subunit
MIEAFQVGAAVRGRTLWDGLDMAFAEGDVCVISGPAGSGKSVLLEILRGARRPDTGDVVAGGSSIYRGDPAANAAFRAASGIVPEFFTRHGSRSVRDLFLLSAAAGDRIPSGELELRREEMLSLIGLPGAQDWRLSSLSTSEMARIALAAELMRGPRYLFADMLIANAGEEWTDMLGGLFKALAKEGKTIVLAERIFPGGWRSKGMDEGSVKGPFCLFRLPIPREISA